MKPKTIWKFTIPQTDLAEIEMPAGAQVLHVASQVLGESIFATVAWCIWAEVDPHAVRETRRFAIYGTGHDMRHDNQVYRGTLFYDVLVFHVYEVL